MEGWMYSFTLWLDGFTDIKQSKKSNQEAEKNKEKENLS
jgi:hypothetical protein